MALAGGSLLSGSSLYRADSACEHAARSQALSRSQLLRGILVDHDVLYGGEALLDGIVGALGYRVGIHQS